MISPTQVSVFPGATTTERDALPAVPNGSSIFNETDTRLEYTDDNGTTWKEIATIGDIPADTTAFGEMFFQGNSTETVIALAATPVKVNAVYSSGDLFKFTQASGTLTYTGTATKEMALSLSLTTTVDLVTADISVILFKNGSPIAKSTQSTFTGSTTPGLQSTSVNALVELQTNDTLEVFIQNDGGTDNITVTDLNLNSTTVGGAIGAGDDQVVTSWDGSTASVAVTAGTGITITGGVITAVGGPGGEDLQQAYDNGDGSITLLTNPFTIFDSSSNRRIEQTNLATTFNGDMSGGTLSVNTENVSDALLIDYDSDSINIDVVPTVRTNQKTGGNLLTSTAAAFGYAFGVPTPMWTSAIGTNVIKAGTFDIGSVVEVNIQGRLIINVPSPGTINSSFFVLGFNGPKGQSSNLNTSTFPATLTQRSFNVRFSVARTGATQLTISGSGFFVDIDNSLVNITMPSGVSGTYNEASDTTITFDYQNGVDTAGGNSFDYIADVLTISQKN
jgi:hypothetical protein